MRRISAALIMITAAALGVGCDNDDNHRDWDNDNYRGDRISRDSHWDGNREWDRDRADWDRHYDDRDWDRNHERSADHWRDDRRGEGLMDRDQNRSTWDRR